MGGLRKRTDASSGSERIVRAYAAAASTGFTLFEDKSPAVVPSDPLAGVDTGLLERLWQVRGADLSLPVGDGLAVV